MKPSTVSIAGEGRAALEALIERATAFQMCVCAPDGSFSGTEDTAWAPHALPDGDRVYFFVTVVIRNADTVFDHDEFDRWRG